MITGKEYRSEVLKIAGFGLLSPIGKFILSILDLGFRILSQKGLFFLCMSLVFGYFRIILISRGLEIAEDKN